MAMAINKVIVIGNLGANPTVRTLPKSGQNVANFSLATTERFTDRSGTKQERTEWHRVVAFGRLAETCERFLSKGRQVYIEGRLTTREYEAKDGSGKRYRTEIVARQLRLLGNRANAPKAEASDDIPF
jgi:single-strand DNA-binding protein